jgi:DNA-directed RNA polymerase subunit RPC12/RpoP
MIKCPNCGSTAQVKIITQETFSYHERHTDTVYKCLCGCGQQFAFHEEVRIGLFKNNWEGYTNYVGRKKQETQRIFQP